MNRWYTITCTGCKKTKKVLTGSALQALDLKWPPVVGTGFGICGHYESYRIVTCLATGEKLKAKEILAIYPGK